MLNPIAQMKQHQTAKITTQNGANYLTSGESKAIHPQPQQKNAQKANKSVLRMANFPQWDYQFGLILFAIERCKAEFPDCYHHKQQFAKECKNLKTRLKAGKSLLQKLAEDRPLVEQQQIKQEMRAFIRGVDYLNHKLESIIQYVAEVEAGTNTPHYHKTAEQIHQE